MSAREPSDDLTRKTEGAFVHATKKIRVAHKQRVALCKRVTPRSSAHSAVHNGLI